MCGIAGFISKQHDRETLTRMTTAIAHRGPDAAGYFFDEHSGAGLGHRRLSILDLSEDANQPFWSADRRYAMIYNGEVYNFREIAAKYSMAPRTTSDTEIIIEGFALKGPAIFAEFNGMFTLAIWDQEKGELTIARDRIGIKPLFIHLADEGLAFGSEIKALLQSGRFEVNRDAIADFLYLGYLPGSESLFSGIDKFPAGHYGTYSINNGLQVTPFWQAADRLAAEPADISSVADAKKQLSDLLVSSVTYRMISDVPLGTFLSGGTDSSTVTAIAQKIAPHPVMTFSIGFKDSKFNEAHHAKRVAEHLGTDHYEFMLEEQQALELFDQVLDIYDEPFADSSSIPTLLVSEIARKHVTVALSGDGGDELFMGYGMYNWANRLRKPGVSAGRKLIAAGLEMGSNRYKRAAHLFRWKEKERLKSHIFSQEQYYFSALEIDRMLRPGIPSQIHLEEEDPSARSLSPREAQAFFDINNYLKDDLLVKVDRASMRHSLEVRVPILDHRIVEFALNLPERFKVRNGTDKFLLKEVLYDHVPKELFDRPKWGFGIPLHNWLKNDLKYLIDTHLDTETVEKCKLVRTDLVMQLKKRFFAGEDYLYNRIWALLILHKWYKKAAGI